MDDKSHAGTDAPEKPPYVIEGARSGAAKCKTCRRKISKGRLRLGVLVDGFFGPGYMWHHLECAARRQLGRVEEAYALESWKEAKVPPKEVPPLEELREIKRKADEQRASRKELPYIEIDPSGRARCKQCGEPIEKGSLRVAVAKEARFGDQVRVGPMIVHPRCTQAAISRDEVATEMEGLAEALRENSEGVEPGSLGETIATICGTD